MERLRLKAEVISLGCRLNIAESEQIRALLAHADDVVVVNSCAVTSAAVRQTRQAIRQARKARPEARLLVTGCAAEIEREALASMPEVDGLIANAAKLDPRAWNVPPQAAPTRSEKHTRAFIAVQNGCNHACTFCVIPQGRGTSRSLTVRQVLREVERHLALGTQEMVGGMTCRASQNSEHWYARCSTLSRSSPACACPHSTGSRSMASCSNCSPITSASCRTSTSRCSTGTI
jgi:tRNA A37 methylthiotransferase MiaB